MKESLVYNKSLNYAIRIVNLYNYMIEIKKETIIANNF